MKLEIDQLRQFIPLEKLGRKSLEYLLTHARALNLKKGDTLFKIGDTKPVTYFLSRGAVKMTDEKGAVSIIESGSERSKFALGNLLPRQFHVRIASERALVMRINKDLLDKETAWGQLTYDAETGIKTQDNEWKIDLLRTPVFAKLPMRSVQALFDELEEVSVTADETVVQEGAIGDYYYIIRSGQCKVVRNVGGRQVVLGKLKAPAGFGDEALVANKPRNASVIMETDGLLLRLSEKSFHKLMHAPLTKRIDVWTAQADVKAQKAMLIDVRMEEEFAQKRLPNAINIPLFLLYLKTKTLNKELKYILYCDDGARSEAGAFILTRCGFDSYVLNNPDAALRTR